MYRIFFYLFFFLEFETELLKTEFSKRIFFFRLVSQVPGGVNFI